MTRFQAELTAFDKALAKATQPEQPFEALWRLTDAVIGAKLFTLMEADMKIERSGRIFTSHPEEYPVSGSKPITYNAWFDVVHKERRTFVANNLVDIDEVFPDAVLIGKLGCASVINLPIVLNDTLVGTVNILNGENHHTEERVKLANTVLSIPAKAAWLASRYIKNQQA
ncbi:GAF domain-containing protein [Paenochrobactrum sp. BZR 201-1]